MHWSSHMRSMDQFPKSFKYLCSISVIRTIPFKMNYICQIISHFARATEPCQPDGANALSGLPLKVMFTWTEPISGRERVLRWMRIMDSAPRGLVRNYLRVPHYFHDSILSSISHYLSKQMAASLTAQSVTEGATAYGLQRGHTNRFMDCIARTIYCCTWPLASRSSCPPNKVFHLIKIIISSGVSFQLSIQASSVNKVSGVDRSNRFLCNDFQRQ